MSSNKEIANHSRRSTCILLWPFLQRTTNGKGVDRLHHRQGKPTTTSTWDRDLTHGPTCWRQCLGLKFRDPLVLTHGHMQAVAGLCIRERETERDRERNEETLTPTFNIFSQKCPLNLQIVPHFQFFYNLLLGPSFISSYWKNLKFGHFSVLPHKIMGFCRHFPSKTRVVEACFHI